MLRRRPARRFRQIRHMVAKGVVPRPRGSRSKPIWGTDHLRAVEHYRRLRAAGLTPAMIGALPMKTEDVSFSVLPGVTLFARPKAARQRGRCMADTGRGREAADGCSLAIASVAPVLLP